MKIKRKLSLMLSLILTTCLATNYGNVVSKADTTAKPELTVSSKESENCVSLKWSSPDKDKYYSYRLFSKASNEAIFQSIPSKATVKVLNIHPTRNVNNQGELIPCEQFTNWKNESFNLPQSARLKRWMEEPNSENSRGYGKGLIDVDAVSNSQINTNPEYYLKDSNGNWKYDVIMIGSWDYNGNRFMNDEINENCAKVIQKFIDDDRGILFGHDVISELNPVLLNQFKDDIGAEINNIKFVSGTEISVKKKGLLTNYPWNIGEVGTKLTVPQTHTQSQLLFGDVWMSFEGFGSVSDNGRGEQNVYLTTLDNKAMIETGHSSGQATPDEQKILANTLFYLAQVTEDTEWEDHKGQDLTAPTKSELKSVIKDGINNKLLISYGESQDIGSSYEYYVEAKEKSTGNKIKSDIKTTTVTSGIQGYSIVVDQNENTIPDNIIETTSTDFTMDNKFNDDFYVHVVAVDNAGNVSEVSTYKYVYPVLTLTAGDLNTDNNTVTIKAEAKVSNSEIKSITLPNGDVIENTNAEYAVDVNGTYIFSAVDNEGNEISAAIKINNIPGKVTLDDVKVNEDNNSTTVSWNVSDKTQDYSYNVNSRMSDETEFKSTSVNDTTYVDSDAKDIAVPEKSEINSVITDKENGTTLISISEAMDNGTSYDYYIDGTGVDSGLTSKSETKSVTVTSGIKGYSIVVDQNEDTIPDGTITTTSTEYTFDKLFDTDFYVHVAAVDNAGNMSEVSTFKYAYPTMKLTTNTSEVVKDTVTITAEAACEGNTIVKIITPDGKEVEGDTAEYTVDVNGTYTFTAIDNKGDEVTESIEIKNIEPDIIINVEPNMNRTHLKENFIVDLTINNIESIFATEIRIKYDSSRLQFLGLDTVDGIELVNNDVEEGEITLLLASLGFENVLKDTTLLKLNFTGISAGDALIDVVKADVADGDFMEKTLRDAECGETTISIVDRELVSVDNKDKEFTLLDLSIIAKHYGDDPDLLLLEGIDADLNLDGKIDKEDYKKCYELMLKNPNRKF